MKNVFSIKAYKVNTKLLIMAGLLTGGGVAAQDTAKVIKFTYVEKMPEPGYDLSEFIVANLRYPRNGIAGKVVVRFVVDEDGSISDAIVVKGIRKEQDSEALRVVTLMPT